eukprot:CAMPEP_0172539702 /NCGR_PEP_ID=MMETSP1067-20121228/10851_1 /TAXON_ID=265564 ORGANISM="Thalassiosira punctigera, Strain Tpunct2005C2" /NCGR_SAMPLE_ID=MMETSP1067 /ASSEMBLY_ACC=CAM_ASM_000444 /LENGTH=510 /DNA_ID=CAMNT_0013325427 /DNA_START=288 /DNA_END=1817 /DNA_ORIENTATION=+
MARGNNANRMRANNPHQHHINIQKKQAQCDVQSVHNINEAIERHWESMPDQAKTFLLGTLDFLSLHKLARFWSNSAVVEYTRGGIAGSVCGASWFIALNYLKLGKISEARALTLNGSFLHQCFNTPIETIVEMCGPDFNAPIKDVNVPLFSRGFYSVRTPPTMEAYLQRGLPKEYQHMMASFVNISSPDNVMQYVGQIGDDWSGTSPAKSHHKASSKSSDDPQIQLILVDDANEDKKQSFDIGSSTTLKTLFNDYADKRGVSLRSLRFSYNGKTLFLSSVGNKSPDELHMRDLDVIIVHDTNIDKETSVGNSRQTNQRTTKKSKNTKNSPKRTKGKGKKKQKKQEEPVKTLEEYKAQHSKWLSKLHEEVEQRLKEIRTRLNALDLERQPPKQKRRNKRKKTAKISPEIRILPNPGVGSKAGKSHFMIQVGEVQNLYKTTKPSASSQHHNSCGASTLDLHGCTTKEALVKLDESLEVWVDAAMQGSYPFVIPATIVCGCGSQILSETVEKW